MNPAVRAGLAGWPPGAPPPGRQGGGEANGDFTDLLDSFTARTALAEGQQQGTGDARPDGDTVTMPNEVAATSVPAGDAPAAAAIPTTVGDGVMVAPRQPVETVVELPGQPSAAPVVTPEQPTSGVPAEPTAVPAPAAQPQQALAPTSAAQQPAPAATADELAHAAVTSTASEGAEPALPGASTAPLVAETAVQGVPAPESAAEVDLPEQPGATSTKGVPVANLATASEQSAAEGVVPAGGPASASESIAAVESAPPAASPASASESAAAAESASPVEGTVSSKQPAVPSTVAQGAARGQSSAPSTQPAESETAASGEHALPATPSQQPGTATSVQQAPTAATTSAPQATSAPTGPETSSDDAAPSLSQPRTGYANAESAPAQEQEAAQPSSSTQAASSGATEAEQPLSAPLATVGRRGLLHESPHAASLPRAVESTEAMLRLVAKRGIAQASLSLRPAALGAIEVKLRATSDGVVASVAADSSEAAKLLQHAEGDLRRALEDAGVRLLRLDISWSRDPRAGSGQRDDARNGDGREGQHPDATTATETDTTPETVVQLPNGVLVDVLA
jgi:flagellar hook-length control protein FliK